MWCNNFWRFSRHFRAKNIASRDGCILLSLCYKHTGKGHFRAIFLGTPIRLRGSVLVFKFTTDSPKRTPEHDQFITKILGTLFSTAQHINFMSPQNGKMGPKVLKSGWARKFRELGVSGEFPQRTPVSRELREIHFGDPILVIWGAFLEKMRMAKVDKLGRAETLHVVAKVDPGVNSRSSSSPT